MDPLKLVALDGEDLAVVSTHLQDALIKVGDIVWQPAARRLVMAFNRFDWEGAECGQPKCQRRRSALRFERVNSFKCRNIKPNDRNTVLNLLAVEFAENDPPAGVLTLTFSGGAALRVEVECLECELSDLGPTWDAAARPVHSAD
jgi:Protein of unknown function (DUF2948)